MPRPMRADSRDLLAELARQELVEAIGPDADHEVIFERWKYDAALFMNETQLLGGPLHPPQEAMIPLVVGWTAEPPDPTRRPFIHDSVICKSRQVGMSWFFMGLELWLMIFWPASKILNSSQKFEEVDDGGPNATVRSLHGRILYLYRDVLPAWLRRRCLLHFKRGQILTKRGGFAIAASATPNVGRGGTFDMAFLDEYAHVEWSDQVWAAISQACKRGKVANSTPYGRGNEFFQLWEHSKARQVKKIGYHWSEHPVYGIGLYIGNDGEKRSPWYDAECAKLGSAELIAQELDMSFDRSAGARVYPEFSRTVHLQHVIRNPAVPLLCGWDYGYAGSTSLVLCQLERLADSVQIEVLATYENRGLHIDAYAPIIGQWEVLYGRMQHVGDPAGLARSVTSSRGPVQALADLGIYTDAPHWLHVDAFEGIRLVKLGLAGGRWQGSLPLRIVIDPSCERLADCLENTTYPTDSQGKRIHGREMPTDNEWTHMTDAFRYLVHYACRTMLGYSADGQSEHAGARAYTADLVARGF